MRIALAWLFVLGLTGGAFARSEGKQLAYQRERVWSTAVRFVVVDERAKVIDKDADAGYVLFEFEDGGKRYRGSLEVLVVEDGVLRFVITLVDRPSWMEIAMLHRLEQKLRAELGSPNPPKPKAPPAPAPTPPPAPEEIKPEKPRDP
jgi:hypothetical protein